MEEYSENVRLPLEVTSNSNLYDTGIEEDIEDGHIGDPFDPDEISIDSKVVSMDNCLRRLVQGTIKLNPDFQRKEVWNEEKKSQLIESLMLRIPLPMFYVSADEKNNYTVVDGLQRLSTIRSFILGDRYLEFVNNSIDRESTINSIAAEKLKGHGFPLQKLEFWDVYNGSDFNALPTNIRNNILDTEFRFTVINPGTPEEVRRNIFKRINTGGLPLSGQEIRNALYIGASTDLLNELSEYPEFIRATGGSIRNLRMEDKELILRLLSFFVRDYSTYRRTISVDSLLSDTMIILNAMPTLDTKEFRKILKRDPEVRNDIGVRNFNLLRERFKKAMNRSFMLFDKHTFRKSYGGRSRSPINKALFETWGVVLTEISDADFQTILSKKSVFLQDYAEVIDDLDFQLIISRDSMKNTAVRMRFEKLKNLVAKYKESND